MESILLKNVQFLKGGEASSLSREKESSTRYVSDWHRTILLAGFWALIFWLAPQNNLFSQPAIQWERNFGSTVGSVYGFDLTSVQQTSDGGYILCGRSSAPAGGDQTEGVVGGADIWVVKLSSDGSKTWDRTIKANDYGWAGSARQTADGGYIVCGSSGADAGADKSENSKGERDYWIIRLSQDGSILWDKTIGGGSFDNALVIRPTSDGGFVVGGHSESGASGDKTEASRGEIDYWIVKLSAAGDIQWEKTLGGNGSEYLTSLEQTKDGGYIIGGNSNSQKNGDKSEDSQGAYDGWIVKLRPDGTVEWDKTIGRLYTETLNSIDQTSDGGYIIGGSKGVSGPELGEYANHRSAWLVKLAADGTEQWQNLLLGSSNHTIVSIIAVMSIQQTADGGYILGAQSNADMGVVKDKTEDSRGPDGLPDFWVVKLDGNGQRVWDKTIGGFGEDYLAEIQQTSDSGFIIGGRSLSSSSGEKTGGSKGTSDYWVVKLGPEPTNKKLILSPTSLTFTYVRGSSYPGGQAFLSANSGNPILSLTHSPDNSWLVTSPPVLGHNGFGVNAQSMSAGTYNTTVTVSARGYKSATLQVTLIVKEPDPTLYLSRIEDKVTFVGQQVTFYADARANRNQVLSFSLVNAPPGASITADGNFKWTPNTTGDFTFKVRVTTDLLLSAEDEVTVKVLELTAHDHLRINAGGSDFLASGNRQFTADQYSIGDNYDCSIPSGDILNTTDDELYRSVRCGEYFNYEIPVRNGNYEVVLHFAETWFGVEGRGPAGPRQRLFTMSVEEQGYIQGYDIFARAGGAMRAVQEKFSVSVSDGMLSIWFMGNYEGQPAYGPSVAAIEISLINLGSRIEVPTVADSYVRSGIYADVNYGDQPFIEVKSVDDANLSRASYLKFSLEGITQVTSAKLRVYGQNHQDSKPVWVAAFPVADDTWSEHEITWNNAPPASGNLLGSEAVNSYRTYFEIDVTNFVRAETMGDKVATFLLRDVNNRNKRLIFESRELSYHPPQLVIVTAGPPLAATRISYDEPVSASQKKVQKSVVYPNPVGKKFTLEIADQHEDDIFLEIVNQSGRSYELSMPKENGLGSKLEIDIEDLALNAGIYVLKLQSSALTERIKMLVVE